MGRRKFAEFPQETSVTHHYLCITLMQGREYLLAPSFSTAYFGYSAAEWFQQIAWQWFKRSDAARQVVTKPTTALCWTQPGIPTKLPVQKMTVKILFWCDDGKTQTIPLDNESSLQVSCQNPVFHGIHVVFRLQWCTFTAHSSISFSLRILITLLTNVVWVQFPSLQEKEPWVFPHGPLGVLDSTEIRGRVSSSLLATDSIVSSWPCT